jgi:D-sedoheptulose 7-phosphate isomerase
MQHPGIIGQVERSIGASIAVKQDLLADAVAVHQIAVVSNIAVRSIEAGGKLILFGNGGSAGDAQHIAAEFVGRFAMERRALPALALTVNTSCLTAIANDYGYEQLFARQMEALGRPGDMAFGISTSGNSLNVLRGLEQARALGLYTAALTGGSGGTLKPAVDHCICVPSANTARIQECHILIGHIIAELVEATLCDAGRHTCNNRTPVFTVK